MMNDWIRSKHEEQKRWNKKLFIRIVHLVGHLHVVVQGIK